jgi:hypothetical protein
MGGAPRAPGDARGHTGVPSRMTPMRPVSLRRVAAALAAANARDAAERVRLRGGPPAADGGPTATSGGQARDEGATPAAPRRPATA